MVCRFGPQTGCHVRRVRKQVNKVETLALSLIIWAHHSARCVLIGETRVRTSFCGLSVKGVDRLPLFILGYLSAHCLRALQSVYLLRISLRYIT